MMTGDVGADATADTDTDTDADTRTLQEKWESRFRGVSKRAFVLTLGTVLDTLRRHGHCVFLR